MTAIKGTNLAAPIAPFDDADQYPTHDSIYGMGGWREVADTTARNAIPALRKRIGMAVWSQADAKSYVWDGTSWNEYAARRFDIAFFLGGIPTANQIVLNLVFAINVKLVAGLTGSQFAIGTNPTAALVFSLSKIVAGTPTSIGSISFSTLGVATVTFTSDISFAPGNILSVVAPAIPDVSGANISATLVGTPL